MGHEWDRDGERCLKCGDKDWFAGTECSADTPKKPSTLAQQVERAQSEIAAWPPGKAETVQIEGSR